MRVKSEGVVFIVLLVQAVWSQNNYHNTGKNISL